MNLLDPRLQLRRDMRARRKSLPAIERIRAAAAVAERLRDADLLVAGADVALYWAVQGELPLLDVVHVLNAAGCRLHLPVIASDECMLFAPWQHGVEMTANRFGIPEPVVPNEVLRTGMSLDAILLPLLAFDRAGNRLGSGAGFYDRSFAELINGARPRKPLLIGVAYAEQEVSSLPAQAWDVRLDYILCERELIAVPSL